MSPSVAENKWVLLPSPSPKVSALSDVRVDKDLQLLPDVCIKEKTEIISSPLSVIVNIDDQKQELPPAIVNIDGCEQCPSKPEANVNTFCFNKDILAGIPAKAAREIEVEALPRGMVTLNTSAAYTQNHLLITDTYKKNVTYKEPKVKIEILDRESLLKAGAIEAQDYYQYKKFEPKII